LQQRSEWGSGIQVKVCGINARAAFLAARDAGADFIGLVFFPGSPRYVRPEQAAAIVGEEAFPPRVGLFVDPTDVEVERTLGAVRLDALQIYAAPERAAAIRATFGLPVWRSVSVRDAADIPAEAGGADRLLIEPRAPRDATRPGGNAVTLDWALLRRWTPPAPWLLAGGLTVGNVSEAIRLSGAVAVDVSSGVESSPGVKSADAIHAFVRTAKGSRPDRRDRGGSLIAACDQPLA
jgi:phosphoribosylanthranilate isomerase